jgi:hypothetical protein
MATGKSPRRSQFGATAPYRIDDWENDPKKRLNGGLVRENAAKYPRRFAETVSSRSLGSLCTQETETARRTPKFLVRGVSHRIAGVASPYDLRLMGGRMEVGDTRERVANLAERLMSQVGIPVVRWLSPCSVFATKTVAE